eukprot:2663440-Prymnesium_polylepis.1
MWRAPVQYIITGVSARASASSGKPKVPSSNSAKLSSVLGARGEGSGLARVRDGGEGRSKGKGKGKRKVESWGEGYARRARIKPLQCERRFGGGASTKCGNSLSPAAKRAPARNMGNVAHGRSAPSNRPTSHS